MNKKIFGLVLLATPIITNAQAAFDVLQMSQQDLNGTARSMSMAGAFGALGGDLSTLGQNPAGIGVYRSSDVGITMSLNFNSSKSDSHNTCNETEFNVPNFGYVGAMRLNSDVMPNLNWGITFSRANSFKRHYTGTMNNIGNSVTNYIAGVTNSGNWNKNDLAFTDVFNPYESRGPSGSYAPWASILAYDAYLINPQSDGTNFSGLFGNGTSGFGEYEVSESGHVDEYNFSLGGNLANVLYWGIGVGINDLDYRSYTYYGESLQNALVNDNSADVGALVNGAADFGFQNYLGTTGTGYNFKMGFILKPVNELRIGFAFHTPTYYELKDTYYANASFQMAGDGFRYSGDKETNSGDTRYDINTPWRFIGSVAGVIGQKGILSLDYEYVGNETMRILDMDGNEYLDATNEIKSYFKPTHIIRVGGEYRLDQNWSVRAGYAYKTSPVKDEVSNNETGIVTASTNSAYQFDKHTQYVTLGLGYRYKSVYVDLAYIHKARKSEFHAFSPATYGDSGYYAGNIGTITDNQNRIACTFGLRF